MREKKNWKLKRKKKPVNRQPKHQPNQTEWKMRKVIRTKKK